MQTAIRHIFQVSLSAAIVSILYFLLLALHIPFLVIIPIVAGGVWLFIRWYNKSFPANVADDYISKLSLFIMIVGLMYLGNKIYDVATRHGGWDAWAMWNYHARFLADGERWATVFKSTHNDHPDYPLFIPSLSAFFIRLFQGRFYAFIPFVISVFITISTATLLYVSLARKHIIIGAVGLYLIVNDAFFITRGVSQYSDTLLGFFLLCALLSKEYTDGNKYSVALTAAFLGCCIWTKNEGIVIAAVFVAFNFRYFFTRNHIRYSAAGILLPLIALLVLKVCYAPANDMVSGLHGTFYAKAFMKDRYVMIYNSLANNMDKNFHYIGIIFSIYTGLCIVRKKWFAPDLVMLLFCLFCYMWFYVFTTQDLEWHLGTSQDRLMHQLMPAVLYTLLSGFTGSASEKQTLPNQ